MENPRQARIASSRRVDDADHSKTIPERRGRSSAHITAIDGLRALAIIGVVAYHTRPSLLSGGFLGVTVFFVISGFLITRSLTRQLDRTGTVSYGTYLVRRLKRLVPPVAVIIALTAVASYLVAPSLLPKAQADALPSMLFVSNWVAIFRHVSYFAAAGLPSPLTHLWFLGVTMQFYLLWPIILLVLHRSGMPRKVRTLVVVAFAVVSAVLMAVLYDPAAAGSRVYYGLDTRAAELLCGAVLAMALPRRHDGERDGSGDGPRDGGRRRRGRGVSADRSRRFNVWDGVGVALTVLLVAAYAVVGSDSAFLYRGGYLLAAILVTALLAVAMSPGNLTGRILSVAPLRYLGSRSFSLYLVHYPMLEMMNPATRTTKLAWWEWPMQAIAILAATEVFYQLVEHVPAVMAAGVSAAHSRTRRRAVVIRVLTVCHHIIVVVCAIAVVLLCVLPLDWNAIAQARSAYLRPVVARTTQSKTRTAPSTKQPATQTESSDSQSQTDTSGKLVPVAEKVPKNLDTTGWTYDASTGVCSADPLIISDSIELGARSVMDTVMPNAIQDNKVSRPITEFPELYQQHLAAGEDKRVVIAALGANSASVDRPEILENVVASVNGKPLYFITVRDPVIAQDWVNANLRSVAANHDNVGIMDWHGLSEGHDEYFVDDGTHLTQGSGLGDEAYSRMIVSALCGQ
ncbi:acyltransferase family protein [Bifidobacterium parmae]|uniref:Acyltransferase n=1 Tax=Bifidobacterium parmae TaxID=361854 RepID=A0A2N5IVR3_9BIFI|nr:acyltransferase family protein [Bifidobacterium parmae]PLS26046.1 acyltransferase [Bifidobacterium parmae]